MNSRSKYIYCFTKKECSENSHISLFTLPYLFDTFTKFIYIFTCMSFSDSFIKELNIFSDLLYKMLLDCANLVQNHNFNIIS